MNARLYLRLHRAHLIARPRIPQTLGLPRDFVPVHRRKGVEPHVILNGIIAALLVTFLVGGFYLWLSAEEAVAAASVRRVVEVEQ